MFVKHAPETKAKAIAMRREGKTISTISKELHVAESTLYHWLKTYTSPQSIDNELVIKKVENLTAECHHLQGMIDIIRQSGYIKEISLQRRLAFALDLHTKSNSFTARQLYEALEITKGTFYYRLKHSSDISAKEQDKYALMLRIHEIFEDSNQVFGAEKVKTMLAREGIRVSNKRVSALMRELGLESVRVDAKKQYMMREKYVQQNLLQRNFKTSKPNQVWVSDITCFKVKGKWIYVCVIIDLYSRKVVGYHISSKSSTRLLTTTFKNAFADRGKPKNLTFHSDQGSQYTSKAFTSLLKECNAKQSLSAPGRPLDNAVAEAFFSAFKKEEAYRKDYTSERHFIESVTKYIDFYNNIRPHKTNHYRTPTEMENELSDNLQGEVE